MFSSSTVASKTTGDKKDKYPPLLSAQPSSYHWHPYTLPNFGSKISHAMFKTSPTA